VCTLKINFVADVCLCIISLSTRGCAVTGQSWSVWNFVSYQLGYRSQHTRPHRSVWHADGGIGAVNGSL
jgi:hypothetical protein